MQLSQKFKTVVGLPPRTPSTSTPDYVSLKNVLRMLAIITVDNATTVTGSAITLKQATAVAGTSEKALAFSTVYANTDIDAGDTLTETAVASNTFTTDATDNKNLLYVIDIDPASLDTNNGFDCVRVGTGNATAAVVSVTYLLQLKDSSSLTNTAVITD